MPKITELFLRSAAPGEYWDAKIPSFGVRVGMRTKTFLLKRNNSRLKLGSWPALSLPDARNKALSLKLNPAHGTDISYQEARKLFLETHCRGYRPRSLAEITRQLKRFERHDRRKVSSLTTFEIQKVIDDLAETPSEANHCFKAARTFFRWCVRRRFITNSPLAGLGLPHKEHKRKRVLTEQELRAVWLATDHPDANLPAPFRVIVKLLILLGQRRSETAALAREHYSHNEQTITLPATITKNRREHHFPVGPMAAALLEPYVASTGLLFPARGRAGIPFNGWSKSKKELDTRSGVTGWTLHDLRRTFRTNLGRLGVAPHIAERLVNHISAQSEVEQIYDQWKYQDEMRIAIKLWEAKLAEILSEKTVPIQINKCSHSAGYQHSHYERADLSASMLRPTRQ